MALEEKAKKYATKAHHGQTRKYTGEPYITHPESVVEILKTIEHTETILAAAWLHDVVEDTGVSIERISTEFGFAVALLVGNVTNKSRPEHGNREERKAIDLEHLRGAYPAAQNIKLADIIDNTENIALLDPRFARVYLEEKKAQIEVLQEGDIHLLRRAKDTVQRAADQLKWVFRRSRPVFRYEVDRRSDAKPTAVPLMATG